MNKKYENNLLAWAQKKPETINDNETKTVNQSACKSMEQKTNCINKENAKCEICKLELYMNKEWRMQLQDEFQKDYFQNIKIFLHDSNSFFPPTQKIFNFSNFFPIEKTKVVIIGQDPYHNINQAMGLSFSVPTDVKVPPSLKNIYTEIKSNMEDFKIPSHGDLTKWAEQGVLLLNDVLTVEKHKPGSHAKIGWKEFTTKILNVINENCKNVVFMLWGRHAQQKAGFVDKGKHLVLESAHPSPYSVKNFFGCKHFIKANNYLIKNNKAPINW